MASPVHIVGTIRAKELGRDFAFQIVLNATLSVDSFFFLSGLLVMYVVYGKLDKDKGRMNWVLYFVHRYIRLTPPFLLVSLFLLLGPAWTTGPIWHETIDRFIVGCRSYWWMNALYVTSWLNAEEACLPHGWFLSCDMQYFILAPIFILTIYKNRASGFFLLGTAMVLCMVVIGAVTYLYDLGPMALFTVPDDANINEFMQLIGFRPYTHFGSFAIGMMVGYGIYKYRHIKIPRNIQFTGWVVAWSVGLSVVYGVYAWNSTAPPEPLVAALYGSTARNIWCLCLAWVVFICVTGHGGFVNRLLSWSAFVPLSKMTFMVYLLHPPLMFMYAAHVMNPIYATQFMVAYQYLAHSFAVYCFAFIGCLIAESPFINLEKILLSAILPKKTTLPVQINIKMVADMNSLPLPIHTDYAIDKYEDVSIKQLESEANKDGGDGRHIEYKNGANYSVATNDDIRCKEKKKSRGVVYNNLKVVSKSDNNFLLSQRDSEAAPQNVTAQDNPSNRTTAAVFNINRVTTVATNNDIARGTSNPNFQHQSCKL